MKYCPISDEPLLDSKHYHEKGLRKLDSRLKNLHLLPFSSHELRQEAMARATKLSIQGVQPKLSAALNIGAEVFELVDSKGTFILKPESDLWPELPANEALTMTLAKAVGFETPLHGLLFDQDEKPVYFIQRFDRHGKNTKYAIEDFAQLSNQTRETKYNSSCEQLIKVINQFTTFPQEQLVELLKRLIFCFCTGNEDMHLKNFSLIQKNGISKLSPIYDFLNTTIALKTSLEEIAIPLHGKKNKLTARDFFIYFGKEKLKLSNAILRKIQNEIPKIQIACDYFLPKSYLSSKMQESYQTILQKRIATLMTPFET